MPLKGLASWMVSNLSFCCFLFRDLLGTACDLGAAC